MSWTRSSALFLLVLLPALAPVAASAQAPDVSLRAVRPPSADAEPVITISFDDTPVGAVIGSFARFADFSFVLGEGVVGTISADVRGVPWDDALDAILNAYGMRMVETEAGINVVENIDVARQRIEYVEPETRVFKVRFQTASELLPALQSVLTDRGSIAASDYANALVVTDVPEILDRIERILWGEIS